jgi:hypothetical protein
MIVDSYVNPNVYNQTEWYTVKIITAALAALLFGTVLVSSEAQARCWWNGYNHCGQYHHGWHNGWYHHGYWYR